MRLMLEMDGQGGYKLAGNSFQIVMVILVLDTVDCLVIAVRYIVITITS